MKYKLNDKVQINLKAIKEDCPSEHYIKTVTPYEGVTAEIEQVYATRYLIKFENEHRFVVLENWIEMSGEKNGRKENNHIERSA